MTCFNKFFPTTEMLLHQSSLLLSVLVLLLVPKAFAQDWPCFHPDMSPVTSSEYQPCPNQPGFASMCCATNRTAFPDHCQDNELCIVNVANSAGTDTRQWLWRESCSDSTWQSPFCLKLCITGTGEVSGFHMVDCGVAQCLANAGCCRT